MLASALAARLLTPAVLQQREYLADAEAVRLTRNPQGLASALRKIAADPARWTGASPATARLWIANLLKQAYCHSSRGRNWYKLRMSGQKGNARFTMLDKIFTAICYSA
jgi:Zn-dependent protease with chaperone function